MKKLVSLLVLVIVLGSLLTMSALAAGPAQTVDRRGTPAVVTPLSASEIEALHLALDDEYKALATYQGVLEDLGNVRPFVSIARAEQKHIDALVTLFNRYGLVVPENEWADLVPHFSTVTEAAQAGVQAEIENAALYDQLFQMVEHADIIRVFENLQRASQEQHLPAFERYAN